jgi:hypothetical protein
MQTKEKPKTDIPTKISLLELAAFRRVPQFRELEMKIYLCRVV